MAKTMTLPKIGVNMTEAVIGQWLIKPGDTIKDGDAIMLAETDKATQDIYSTESGIVGKLLAAEGEKVLVHQPIIVLLDKGETLSEESVIKEEPEVKTQIALEPIVAQKHVAVNNVEKDSVTEYGRIKISPLARKMAHDLGCDIANFRPEKPGKRIVKTDILRATQINEKMSAAVNNIISASEKDKDRRSRKGRIVPFSGMRKIIADRMLFSKNTNAQTSHNVKVDMSETVRLRENLKAKDKKVSFNDIIAYAVCKSLLDFPQVNAELTDKGILEKNYVNLGIAVALDKGLIVPVLKDADLMSLSEIAETTKVMANRAKDGLLSPDEYKNGSFTISNLGMFGLNEFVAIINPPESAILAVGKIDNQAVIINEKIEIRPIVSLTLSYDHRIIDGAPAAEFLIKVKQLLENPYLML